MLNKLTGAVFVCALAAPLAAWVAIGAPESYGARKLAAFPKIAKVLSHRPSGRKLLADALLERSPLRLWSVQTVNRVSYYRFGWIETARIVSGRDGWLFYKEDFWGSKCQPDEYFLRGLNAAATMADLAAAAGLRLTVSVSPDKSSVYPEMLHPGAAHVWACKTENGARWRQLARERALGVLDHAQMLQKHKRAGENLYFPTDTHWTPMARALAVRELAAAYYGLAPDGAPEPRPVGGGRSTHRTDMGDNMLLLGVEDSFEQPDFAAAGEYFVRNGDSGLRRRLVVFHDSFYAGAAPFLAQAFPGVTMVGQTGAPGEGGPAERGAKAAEAGGIIYNSVERLFFDRAPRDMAADGYLGGAVLARNRLAARECRDLPRLAALAPEGVGAVESAGGGEEGLMLKLPRAAEGARFCLRAETTGASAGGVTISLGGGAAPVRFEPGRSFVIPARAGGDVIALALPGAWAGRILRVAPKDAGTHIKDVALFSFPPDQTASVDGAGHRN